MNIKELNIENSRLRSEIQRYARLKECFLRDQYGECSGNIVSAHSIQMMGSLSILESDINNNKVVYALTERQFNSESGLVEFVPIGKNSASTFFGFCGTHDKIFQPIEQDSDSVDLYSDEHCFLLSLRAFAISYHRKKEDINLFSTEDKILRNTIKKCYNTSDLDGLLEGSKIGLSDMEPYKKILIDALIHEDYSCLYFFPYVLPFTAPISMCMLTSPPYFFNGKPMNISEDPNFKYSDIITTVVPLKFKTLILLAAFCDDPNGITYLEELDKMDEISLQKALTWHIITNSENCYFSPFWFDGIDDIEKQEILELSSISADVSTPFLKYNEKKFKLNFFKLQNSINR